MQLFFVSFAGTAFLVTMFLTSSDFLAHQFVGFERYIETSNSYVSQASVTAAALQAAQGMAIPTSQLQLIPQPTPQTPTQPTFPPQVTTLEGSRIYVPETTYTTINSDAIEKKLLIQKDYFSKQIDRIYDRLQSTNGDLNDRIDVVGTGGSSGISFATIALGGTGISTVPNYGELLMGDGSGGYTLIATSSLGISGGGGSSQWTTSGSDIYYTTGSVGIGTTTPAANFEVIGSTGIYSRNSTGGRIVFDDSDVAAASTPMSYVYGVGGTLQFGRANRNTSTGLTTGSTESMRIDASGNVGIGTTSPSALLEVAGTGRFTGGSLILTPSTAAGDGFTVLTPITSNGNGQFWRMGIRNAANTDSMLFGQSGSAYTTGGSFGWLGNSMGFLYYPSEFRIGTGVGASPAMTFNSSGNVGIGTSSPARALDVYGNMSMSNVVGDSSIQFGNTGAGVAFIQAANLANNGVKSLNLQISGGNVGIGTTSPQRLLSLYKSSTPALQLVDSTSGSGVNDGFLLTQAGLNSYLENTEIGSMYFRTSATNRMTIDSSGNVGIGTSVPAYPLHVASTTLTDIARFSGSGGTQCTVVTGTGFSCTSDERFKTHIATIDSSALQKVLKLRPVNFNWKYDPEGQIQIGFIAQELEEIFPELVRNDSSGYKSVAYAQLTPLLVKAIQEQNISVEKLSLILDSQDPLPKIFIDRIVAAISQVSNLIVKTITADSVRTKELCVEDVCVTREQFLRMIRDSGARESAPRQDEQDSQEENSQNSNSTEQDTQQEESDESQDQDENEQNDDGNDESTEENGDATVDESTENPEEQAVNNEDQVIADTPETTEAAPDDQTDSRTQDGDSSGRADEGQEELVSEQSESSHESSTEDSGTDGAEGGSAGDSNITE